MIEEELERKKAIEGINVRLDKQGVYDFVQSKGRASIVHLVLTRPLLGVPHSCGRQRVGGCLALRATLC